MPHVCPRCQRTNPEPAAFCYFDGAALRGQPGADGQDRNRLAQEFTFPSGKRCKTFDELVQACQEEWSDARELLRRGMFRQFFSASGRMDLARSAEQAMAQEDPDIALTSFVNSLPGDRTRGPRLELKPRRLALANVLAGEKRQVQLTVTNAGKGVLQGTVSVAAGGEWLRLTGSADNGHCSIKTARDQQISLQVDTRGLAAAQTYGARLTVITNGGVSEVPVKLVLVAHPFGKAPFQGVRAPREMAERMQKQPKLAVPLLESGEVARWFAANSWVYPVRGAQARGVASVQQFFEGMGLARPPTLKMSHNEIRLECVRPAVVRGQVALQTGNKKWVYAQVESDAAWLKVLTPTVSGPQQAPIGFEVDSRLAEVGRVQEGTLTVVANAGQSLTVRVRVTARRAPASFSGQLLRPLLVGALVCLLLRVAVVPLVDLYARNRALASAARVTGFDLGPAATYAGWLQLHPGSTPIGGVAGSETEFTGYFASYFVQSFVLWTWWLGAAAGGWLV
jgi:hypothetical protein